MTTDSPKRAALIILDGWGIGAADPSVNAIAAADVPVFSQLWAECPHSTLSASGADVGLPEGQMGNSEVGHLNIGAGRVVRQMLPRINAAAAEGEFFSHPVLLEALERLKSGGGKLHLMGLLSDGGVHSHSQHAVALVECFAKLGAGPAYLHIFTDGRDTDPNGGLGYTQALETAIGPYGGKIASVIGRYYAMDRDNRWARTQKAYNLMVRGQGEQFASAAEAIKAAYAAGKTDEFIEPAVITTADGSPTATISAGDTVIFFNFRTDRGRQLTSALTQQPYPQQNMAPVHDLHFITLTRYDEGFKGIDVLFEEENLINTLGEVVSAAGLTQVRAAETEKYPHVTFFFSGGREKPFGGEARILAPSPKVATYDLQPEMSANELTAQVIEHIEQSPPSLLVLNYANTDMVGHTGVLSAGIRAAETVDACLGQLMEVLSAQGYSAVIIADHGNAELMVNPDGSPNTAHTTNPVPIILAGTTGHSLRSGGRLADVAPTLLALLGVGQPTEMQGNSLLHQTS